MKLLPFLLAGLVSTPLLQAELPPLMRFSVENMDRQVSPGTDFYRFANGHWLKETRIPPDQTTWGPTTALVDRNAMLLRDLLEHCAEERPGRTPVEAEVGDFYAAAMDTKRLDALGFQRIQMDLETISAVASKADLAALLGNLQERGIGGMFEASVSADEKQSTIYALTFSQGGLTLPDRDYYAGPQFAKERTAFQVHLKTMLTLLGTPAEQVAPQIKSILGIETALAKVSRKLEDLTDPIANYHPMPLAGLEKMVPSFDWRQFLQASHAAPTEAVILGQPEFFKGLERALATYSLDDWKAYLRWHVLVAAAPLLHGPAEQASFDFFGTVLDGQPQIDPRWKRATRHVDEALGEALGQLYVDKYFPAEARTRMEEMVKNLRAVYREHLGRVPWMREATRQQAVAKFDRFQAKIGAPKKFRDYSSIVLRRDDYLGNVERASQFESRREMGRIGQPVDRSEWEMTPPTVNAYFNQSMNEVVFPAGILQPPFFDLHMDDAVNYGATGATIGHEMTHGFDNDGRKYDAEGNLRDWWTKADAREFEARAAKLVKQFNAYQPLPGLHINGKQTLAENIADFGGLVIAYEAMERALGSEPEKRQPIDGFSPEQRFFISYAQSWAALERDAYLRRSLTTDVHAPDRFRGFAPLLNMPEFYDAFGIKKGAPLWRDPAVRAVIW